MQFDLISDLHVDHWSDNKQIEWSGIPTSLIAVIAGDISQDLDRCYRTITEISKHYKHVIFVDGNHEHNGQPNINERRAAIHERFSKYRNISYLFRNTIILDSTVFIGCNGWWSFDFGEPMVTKGECMQHMIDKGFDTEHLMEQWNLAIEDAEFLCGAVNSFSENSSIKNIVLVTHTVPLRNLCWVPNSNLELVNMGMQGSSYLESVLSMDTNRKINVWAFGHVHAPQDIMLGKIRFVSNPRGIPNHLGSQEVYYPKYIKC